MMFTPYYIISFIALFAVEEGSGCLVAPSAAAVIAGNITSLTCASGNNLIGWSRGSDYDKRSVIFQASSTENNVPRILVDGYLANDSISKQVTLIMNSASTVQADRYYCTCYPFSVGTASVTVLVSKPTLSITSPIIDGEPITITCNISFNGTAEASVKIIDISEEKLAEKSERGTYPSSSNDLHIINLDYNITANSSVNQTYSCLIVLTDNSTVIYSEQFTTSVHWVPVGNVQIKPADSSRCSSGGQCTIDQTILCATKGNPDPILFQWTIILNGSKYSMNQSSQLNLTRTGNYTVQCTAFNLIRDITYNSTSEYFKTEVTVQGPPTSGKDIYNGGDDMPMKLGVGIGVGVGLLIIIVLVIVIIIFWKRKKRRTVCCNPADKGTKDNQSVELSKNGNTDKGAKKIDHSTGVPNKGFENNDETTLVENDLYSRNQSTQKAQIDPSDGGYASVNEVISRGK